MKNFKTVLILASMFAATAHSAGRAEKTAVDAAVASPTAKSSLPMADGEIRKIDKDSKKITLKHGEIKNLDMPGMTMVFRVNDLTLLDNVKVGDKVKFTAEQLDGAIVVTNIQRTTS